MPVAARGAIVAGEARKGEVMTAISDETEVKTSVAKVIEVTSESPVGFEDAIRRCIDRASETVDDIRSAWVESQQVIVRDGRIAGYRVDLKVTFVIH
jgi:flavin-binding protein dodecin